MNIYKKCESIDRIIYLSAYSTTFAIAIAIFLVYSVLTPTMANAYPLTKKIVAQDAAVEAALTPQPKFTPEKVVRIQLDALANNDKPYQDAGIEIAFRFAHDQCWMTDAVMRFEITFA